MLRIDQVLKRRPSRARHGVRMRGPSVKSIALALACIVALWVAWKIVADTAAQNLADINPELALDWRATQRQALAQLAQQKVKDSDFADARDLALQSLLANPLDAQALSLLGIVAEREGDAAKAETLMRLAAVRTRRDATTQAWLFNLDVRHHEYASALAHMDALLNAYEGLWSQFLPILAAFTADPQSFAALERHLETNPIWRSWLLTTFSESLTDGKRLTQLFTALKQTGSPPRRDELRAYVARLIKDGRVAEARGVWRDTLDAKQKAAPALLYNGDFAAPIDGFPFNWALETIPGADIRIVPAPGERAGQALRVQFSGARVQFDNVSQLLMLPPGNYVFSGRVKTDALNTSRGLWWHIFCVNPAKDTLAETRLVSGSVPWTEFSVALTVPASGCDAQWLKLELPARIAPERQIEGQVWYRDLRIVAKAASESNALKP